MDNKFEKINIDEYKKNQKNNTLILNQENKKIIIFHLENNYFSDVYENNNPFKIEKIFFINGNIKEKALAFNNGASVGTWYHFDETGRLIKEENTDEGYDFKPEDVVKYCESHKIKLPKGYQDSGYKTSVYKKEIDGKKVWQISYVIAVGKEEFIEEIILDGKTGKLIKKKQVSYINN
ncbi:hypothetical protein [Chryseobacterium sp. G0201]|uniref:hypothetical protein n=1 Tax=Chryseobacterium sp. G0201 TaxID=2487065 RepID=UPI001E4DE8A5|nr:hypothetical protein [Chryseobacterium sp. G0201]